jgi:protein-S-isoprenylcysteine O-methyltransferase Ste14
VKRISAIAGTGVFLLLAPGTVAGLVPWWITRWRMQPPLLGFSGSRVIGALMITVGIAVVLDSFARFALQGLGTPAPVLPTRHLVVSGLYRYVRNPMYVGVLGIILGQGLLIGDGRLFAYGVLLWLVVHVFVVGYEEPTLRRSFGSEYEVFRHNRSAVDSAPESLAKRQRLNIT